jgi:hypothetical protein
VNTDQPLSQDTPRSGRSSNLILRVRPLQPIPTAAPEWLDKIRRWEATTAARRFREHLEAREIGDPGFKSGFWATYAQTKAESMIDHVRRGLYNNTIARPFVWFVHHNIQRWAGYAWADYGCAHFFGGMEPWKFKNRMTKFNRNQKVRVGLGHIGVLTSPNVYQADFRRCFEVQFHNFPLNVGLVRRAIDLTLRKTTFANVYVDFYCVADSLDEMATRLMRDKIREAYAESQN